MPKFRRKPEIIEAVQWLATKQSWDEIIAMNCPTMPGPMGTESFLLKTAIGDFTVRKNDWIVKSEAGEFCRLKPKSFNEDYEPAE